MTQGLALGNALSDPFNMLGHADHALQLGLVDIQGWKEMKRFQKLAEENWPNAEARVVRQTNTIGNGNLLITVI